MLKVLIIDDEEPVRDAITILADWSSLQVSEVFEATNGKSGLAMLEEHEIDIVLLDMKMPELSGSEFLQIIEKEYPDLMTIVISGYNDFEFTRQAIHSKVVDYLLKPINRIDLNQALRKAVDVIAAKRQSESEFIYRNMTLNMSLPKLKETIYQSIIDRAFKKSRNKAFLPLIGADDEHNRFGAAVFRILNLDEVKKKRFNEDISLLHFAISNVLSEATGQYLKCFSFANPKQERELVAVLTSFGKEEEDMAFQAYVFLKKAVSTLKELFGIISIAAIGQPGHDVLMIAESHDQAKQMLQGVKLVDLERTSVIQRFTDAGFGEEHRDKFSLMAYLPKLRHALELGNENGTKSVIAECIQRITASSSFLTVEAADRTLHELLVMLNDIALELGVAADKLPSTAYSSLADIGISADYSSLQEYEQLLYTILAYYGKLIRGVKGSRGIFDVADIKEYIDKYYFQEITIATFTEKYFLSREYLMKLFKQQYGCGIHEYAQKVRMEQAKQLLSDPHLKILEISERLGYKDKNYFSKAFRNYYDMSPSEYRASLERENSL